MKKISVLSGDKRQTYINQYLQKKGYDASIKTNFSFEENEIIICGTPFSKKDSINCDLYSNYPVESFNNLLKPNQIIFGGSISSDIKFPKNIKVIDFLNDPMLIWENAYLTAEGLIAKIISDTPFSLKGKNITLIGFGKCGMNIARLLKFFDCNVSVYDHTKNNLARAVSFGYTTFTLEEMSSALKNADILINTVPKSVLEKEALASIKTNCFIYDISSFPYGIQKDETISPITCPGIPGIFSPETAGELIAKTIISYLERNGINDTQL